MSTTATQLPPNVLQRDELPSMRPSGRFGDVVFANLTRLAASDHAIAAGCNHRVAGLWRDAVHSGVRPAVSVDRRVGPGTEQVRRAGDDLRHRRHVDHRVDHCGSSQLRYCAVSDRTLAEMVEAPTRHRNRTARSDPVDRLWHVGTAGFRSYSCASMCNNLCKLRSETCRSSAGLSSGPPVGIGILSAGIILAIMIIPFIAAVMRDVFEVTPALAEGVGIWARLDDLGSGLASRDAVHQSGCRGRHHARARPRARRDDGGDVRDRQLQSAEHVVAV